MAPLESIRVCAIQNCAVLLLQTGKGYLHCLLQQSPIHSKVEGHFMAIWQMHCCGADAMLQQGKLLGRA